MILTRQINTNFAFAIILLLASGIGLWLWIETSTVEVEEAAPLVQRQENRDDTSNWKTYRNEKYGFEVKYPKDWEDDPNNEILKNTQGFGDISKNENGFSIIYKPELHNCGQGVGCFYPGRLDIRYNDVDLLRKNKIKSFDEYAQQYSQLLLEGSRYQTRNFLIDGHRAIEFQNIVSSGSTASLNPDFAVLIEYSSSAVIGVEGKAFPEYKNSVLQVFEDLISTFKFTSPEKGESFSLSPEETMLQRWALRMEYVVELDNYPQGFGVLTDFIVNRDGSFHWRTLWYPDDYTKGYETLVGKLPEDIVSNLISENKALEATPLVIDGSTLSVMWTDAQKKEQVKRYYSVQLLSPQWAWVQKIEALARQYGRVL